MIIEQVSFAAPFEKRNELGRALATLVGPTQVEHGCLACRLFQTWDRPGEFRMEAQWMNVDSLIRHLQTDTYKRLLLLMELGSAPPVLEFFTVEGIRGLDLIVAARSDSGASS